MPVAVNLAFALFLSYMHTKTNIKSRTICNHVVLWVLFLMSGCCNPRYKTEKEKNQANELIEIYTKGNYVANTQRNIKARPGWVLDSQTVVS